MADVVEMVVFVLQVSDALWKRIHLLSHFRRVYHDTLAGSINVLETLSKDCVRGKPWCCTKNSCSTEDSVSRVLFGCFHVGRYCPPSREALKALVRVIDEDPVFVLVVSLRVITCSHWERNWCESWFTALPRGTTQYWGHDIRKKIPQFLFGKNCFSLCKSSTFACLCSLNLLLLTNIFNVLFPHFCHFRLPKL